MDRWEAEEVIKGCMDEWSVGRQMNGWLPGCMGGWQVDEWMDAGWMGG